jgi:hypothetical protein
MSSKAEKRHMGRVAELGCYLCHIRGYGHVDAQVHHLREGQGGAQRASDYLTVPLCDRHHANSSPDGIHGQRREWKLAAVGEMDALAWTLERLCK